MVLAYRNHALRRMRRRKFTSDDVAFCLANAERDTVDMKGNHRFDAMLLDGRRIRVVLDMRTAPAEVITVIQRGGQR